MTIGFAHKATGHLLAPVGTSDTQLIVDPQAFESFIRIPGDDKYAILRDPINREIVKIDIATSVSPFLKVARGQGGSTAQNWKTGALIISTTHANHYNNIIQAGEYRTISYNPNEILTPLYAGEKIYQDSPAGCERWWKSFNGVDSYWDLITGAPCNGENWTDIGWTYNILLPVSVWESHYDNTEWEDDTSFYWHVFSWEAGNSRWLAQFQQIARYDAQMLPIGPWATDYRAEEIRVTLAAGTGGSALDPRTAATGGTPINVYIVLDDGGSGENVELTYDGGDGFTWTVSTINSNSGDIIALNFLVPDRANLETEFYVEDIEFNGTSSGGGVWGTGGGGG